MGRYITPEDDSNILGKSKAQWIEGMPSALKEKVKSNDYITEVQIYAWKKDPWGPEFQQVSFKVVPRSNYQ